MKKILRNCLLLILTVFVVISCIPQLNEYALADNLIGNIITVSLDGTKDYTSIQEAIDNASAGDTISVYNGTYNEHITINKTLTISGEHNTTTIIDGQSENSSIVTITANNVDFSGFTIQNGSNLDDLDYSSISIQSQNNTIYSNFINDSTFGIHITNEENSIYSNSFDLISIFCIYIESADNNTIYSNNISSDNESYLGYGILIEESSNNYIHHNTIMKCMVGLGLSVSPNNILKFNNMSNNIISFGILGDSISDFYNDIDTSNLVDGLHIYYLINQSDITIDSSSHAATVYCINCTNMTIINSNLQSVDSGVALYQTDHSRIENCTIINCGIGIDLFDEAHNNTIENNIIKNCDNNIAIGSNSINNIVNNNQLITTINNPGLVLRESNYNIITNNEFLNCRTGMYIVDSKYIDIQNNTINHSILNALSASYDVYYCIIANNIIINSKIGINLDDGVKFNTFYANNISYNAIGINCTGDGVSCTNNTFYHNDFFDNSVSAIDSFTNTWYNTTTKEGNYWSDYTGKEGSRKGIGDIPYNVSGGTNQDLYPLVKPYQEPTSDLVFIMLVIAVILAIVFITIIAIFVRKK